MTRNHFTPFLVDNPGPKGAEHLAFEGEARRRKDRRPCRLAVAGLLTVAILSLLCAAAIAADRLQDLDRRYAAEARI